MNHTQQPATLAPERIQLHPVDADPVEADLTPADVLNGAAIYIERHGRHQGEMFANLHQLAPPACMHGAIRMSASGGRAVTYTPATAAMVEETISVLAEYLCGLDYPQTHDTSGDCVADWNDTPGRTPAHVVAALRAAARQWEHAYGGAR